MRDGDAGMKGKISKNAHNPMHRGDWKEKKGIQNA
jgi:hypothetical protein